MSGDETVPALNRLIERARLDGRGLDKAALLVARDSVERHDHLMAAITRHHFDSTHLAGKGLSVRLADRMLYEEAGLPLDSLVPVVDPPDDLPLDGPLSRLAGESPAKRELGEDGDDDGRLLGDPGRDLGAWPPMVAVQALDPFVLLPGLTTEEAGMVRDCIRLVIENDLAVGHNLWPLHTAFAEAVGRTTEDGA